MKTQGRFTPALLRRWHDKLRGAGTFDAYTAWHQITSGDPSSRGRSTIEFWSGSAALTALIRLACSTCPRAQEHSGRNGSRRRKAGSCRTFAPSTYVERQGE